MSKVELKNVTKIYDKTNKAIDNLSLTINNGEFFILLGPTGAGKTTTLRYIAGLDKIILQRDKGTAIAASAVSLNIKNVSIVFCFFNN